MDTGNPGEHVIVVKKHTIPASEWLSWRKRGLSSSDIAAMLGISPSMARLLAQKFRKTGVPDLQYWKQRPGRLKKSTRLLTQALIRNSMGNCFVGWR